MERGWSLIVVELFQTCLSTFAWVFSFFLKDSSVYAASIDVLILRDNGYSADYACTTSIPFQLETTTNYTQFSKAEHNPEIIQHTTLTAQYSKHTTRRIPLTDPFRHGVITFLRPT